MSGSVQDVKLAFPSSYMLSCTASYVLPSVPEVKNLLHLSFQIGTFGPLQENNVKLKGSDYPHVITMVLVKPADLRK